MIASRSDTTSNKIFPISKNRLESIKTNTRDTQSLITKQASTTEFEPEHTPKKREIDNAVKATIDANELPVNQDRTVFGITLGDAVEVMKDLKVEDGEFHLDETWKVGSTLGRRYFRDKEHQKSDNRNKYGRDKRQMAHVPSGQGPKATTMCQNCSEPNHWYRNPECIYEVIKGLLTGREIASDTA